MGRLKRNEAFSIFAFIFILLAFTRRDSLLWHTVKKEDLPVLATAPSNGFGLLLDVYSHYLWSILVAELLFLFCHMHQLRQTQRRTAHGYIENLVISFLSKIERGTKNFFPPSS